MKAKITVREQIEVLEEVLENIKTGRESFICLAIKRRLLDKGYREYDDFVAKNWIPLCNPTNAMKVCRKENVTRVYKRASTGAWWPHGDKTPRITFINWMINELKKQL